MGGKGVNKVLPAGYEFSNTDAPSTTLVGAIFYYAVTIASVVTGYVVVKWLWRRLFWKKEHWDLHENQQKSHKLRDDNLKKLADLTKKLDDENLKPKDRSKLKKQKKQLEKWFSDRNVSIKDRWLGRFQAIGVVVIIVSLLWWCLASCW